jgi:2-isopropylmalate synthase
MTPIFLYDTTLRDGSQREDISFSVEDKLSIVNRLAAFGMHYIECGWPGSNPKDAEFFARANRLNLPVRLAAFGRTRNANKPCADDANLHALVVAGTPAVTLVGKAWDYHVSHVLSTTYEENLAMIADSVAWIKAQGREVIFDAAPRIFVFRRFRRGDHDLARPPADHRERQRRLAESRRADNPEMRRRRTG